MQSCPECKTEVNVITLGAIDTILNEVVLRNVHGDLAVGPQRVALSNSCYHIKGRRVRCIKCKKDFLIVNHMKLLVVIDETPKD